MKITNGQRVVYMDETNSPFPAMVLEKKENGNYLLLMEYRQNGDVKIEAKKDQLKPWT